MMKVQRWRNRLRWAQPGLGIKRWLLLLGFGVLLFGLGGAALLRGFYPLPVYFYYLTLQFLPRFVRTAIFFLLGAFSIGMGLWQLNRTLLAPFTDLSNRPYADVFYDYRRRGRGPRIVVLGGGHGQANILRGLKQHTTNLTAIVTVADDGGSSGRLRQELGGLPPGDFRNCIAALADDEALVTQLLQYRFSSQAGLNGHSFGNLFISAMASVTGSFETALEESSRVLAVQGKVLPSTLEAVVLAADVQIGAAPPTRICGESRIPQPGGQVIRVLLDPMNPKAYPKALQAILNADLIVVGPGSLYTSVMPNLLVPEISRAIRASRAPKVYVCNITNQPGETDGYTAEQHLAALEMHLGASLFSIMVVNTPPASAPPPGLMWVAPEVKPRAGLHVIKAELWAQPYSAAHDSVKLAQVIMGLVHNPPALEVSD